ncbi:MAG: spore coat U domain-containing protein [Geminicoccaceae bacterium]
MAWAKTPLLLLLVLLPAGHAAPARAGTDTDILTVTATVLSACSLSGGTLNFGSYTSGQTANLDVTGVINYVNCSGSLTFALDGGLSGNVNARQMQQGANRLSYQIYRNAVRNAVWGTGADAQGVVLVGTQSGSVTVYGRIPSGQVVQDGTYTDTVNVTLTF